VAAHVLALLDPRCEGIARRLLDTGVRVVPKCDAGAAGFLILPVTIVFAIFPGILVLRLGF